MPLTRKHAPRFLLVLAVVCLNCIESPSQQAAPQYRIGVDLVSGANPSCPVFVGRVHKDSPAATAEIRPGDQLVAVDGADIRDLRDAAQRLASTKPKPVTLTLLRHGARLTVKVEREDNVTLLRKDGWKMIADGSLVRADATDAEAEYQPKMERSVEGSNQDLAVAFPDQHYPVDKQVYYPGFEVFLLDKGNLVIVGGIEDGPASRVGLRWGDRLVTISGIDPRGKSAAEIESMLTRARPASITVTTARGGAPTAVSFELERADAVLRDNQKKVMNGHIVPLWLSEKYLACWQR